MMKKNIKNILNIFISLLLISNQMPLTVYAEEAYGTVSSTEETDTTDTTNKNDELSQIDEDEKHIDNYNDSETKTDESNININNNNSSEEENNQNSEMLNDELNKETTTDDNSSVTPSPEDTHNSETDSEKTDEPVQSENSANAIQNNNSHQIEVNPEEIKTKSTEYFPSLSESNILTQTMNGESLIVLSGNTDDKNFIDMVNGYVDIYENIDDQELKQSIFFLDKDSINDKDTNKLITLSNEKDREKLRNGINELKNSSIGNGVAFYIFNQRIIKVSSISDGNYDYTWFDIAHYDIQAYSHSVGKTGMETESDKGVAGVFTQLKSIAQTNTPSTGNEDEITTPPAHEGQEWNYAGREVIQEFTAPVNGIYRIRIWGADGDTDTAYPRTYSAGVGGQGGYTYGSIHLTAGQTIYLAMGTRNDYRNGPSYNGGGAGYGQNRGYLAGGGGAASVYLTSRGNGELRNYSNNRDEIIMVAGGGGGAEDWYTGWPRYCAGLPGCIGSIYPGNGSLEQRAKSGATAYGGAGGGLSGTAGNSMSTQNVYEKHNGAPGANTVDGQKISGYLFGVGEDYAAGDNASAGAGGGGYYGGLSYHSNGGDASNIYGGAGGGGSGYYNTKLLVAGSYGSRDGNSGFVDDGGGNLDGVYFGGLNTMSWPQADDGQNARGIITLEQIDSYKLTINYLDVNTKGCKTEKCITLSDGSTYESISKTYTNSYKFGDEYSVDVPVISGFTPSYQTYQNEREDKVPTPTKGKMPEHDVTINIFYDYPSVVVYYKTFDTDEFIYKTYGENPDVRMKTGTHYEVNVPSTITAKGIKYELFNYHYYETVYPSKEKNLTENGKDYKISNNKTPVDEIYTVYYVPIEYPTKQIVAINGQPVSKASSDGPVEMKLNDIVTYQITYINRTNINKVMTFTDTLPNTLQYVESVKGTPVVEGQKLTWTITTKPRTGTRQDYTVDTVQFKAKVINDSGKTVINCVEYLGEKKCRTDNIIKVKLEKTATPNYSEDLNNCDNAYVAHTEIIEYTIKVTNTGQNKIKYILVKDVIPANTEFFHLTNNNNGKNINGQYIQWRIPDLAPGASTSLNFSVKVTGLPNGAEVIKILNKATYDTVMDYETASYDKLPYSTNQIMHCEVGPRVTAEKSADPPSGSKVNNNDVITYSVQMKNIGSVTTDYLRMKDRIPDGTTYIPGSLSMVSSNKDSMNHYSFTTSAFFDVYYDFNNNNYVISNSNMSVIKDSASHLIVYYPNGNNVKSINLPSGWGDGGSDATHHVYVTNGVNNSPAQLKNVIDSIRIGGPYGSGGQIKIEIKHENQTVPGNYFDVNYNVKTGKYTLVNIKNIGVTNPINNDGVIRAVEINFPSWMRVTEGITLPNNRKATGNTYIYYNYNRGSYSSSQIQNWLKNLSWTGAYGTQGSISVMTFDTAMASLVDGNNLHLYEMVHSNTSWSNARANAHNRTISVSGSNSWNNTGTAWHGYLATITSQTEQDIINNGLANERSWLGGHRDTYGTGWWWVEGPENGQKFYATATYNGQSNSYNGGYNHFNNPVNGGSGAEPNDAGGEPCLQAFWENSFWNDFADSNSLPFIVEYSGTVTQLGTNVPYLPLESDWLATGLSTPSDSLGCKYITDNGDPYVECVTKDIIVSGTATMTFKVKVNSDADKKYSEIDNIAKYETIWKKDRQILNAGDIKTEPDQETNMTVHYLGTPSITVSKAANPKDGEYVDVNDTVMYSLTVKNTGTAKAKFIQIRDAIPKYTTYFTSSDGGAYVNGPSGLENDNGKGYVEWVLKDLAPGMTKTITFKVIVDKDAPSKQSFSNIAFYKLLTDDPGNPGLISTPPTEKTNTITHHLPCIPTPQDSCGVQAKKLTFEVNKTSDPVSGSNVARQSDINYTITIKNTGDMRARHILLRDYIPEGTTFVKINNTSFSNTEKSSEQMPLEGVYVKDGNYVEWVVHWLEPNDTVSVSFTVNVDKETTLKEIHNTALYLHDINENTFGNPGQNNNIDKNRLIPTNETIHKLIEPQILVEKSANPETNSLVAHYQVITYKLNVKNTGTVLANYSFVEDKIPTYTSYVEDSATVANGKDKVAFTTVNSKPTLQWILYDMKPNEERELTFKVIVNEDAPQGRSIFNSAFYNTTITNEGGTPGTPEFKIPDNPDNPKKESNQTVHGIELMKDIIDTGGTGWSNKINIIGTSLLILSIVGVLLLITKKNRKE